MITPNPRLRSASDRLVGETAAHQGRQLVTIDADLLYGAIDDLSARLGQAATQAVATVDDLMSLASFCSEVRQASVEVSLEALERRIAADRLDEVAHDLNRKSRTSLATVQRVAKNTGLLMASVESASESVMQCVRALDEHGGTVPEKRTRSPVSADAGDDAALSRSADEGRT